MPEAPADGPAVSLDACTGYRRPTAAATGSVESPTSAGGGRWGPLDNHGFVPPGRPGDRPRDRRHDVRVAIGLLQQHRVRAERKVPHEGAGDEDMRPEALSEDRLDGGNAAHFAQPDIDDHEIGMKARGRGHRFGRVAFDGADEMAEILENL